MSPKVSAEYKERKKREILSAAAAVFSRKGYEPTTMKDIKEEAGISFGALYAYFSSTEEIFAQLFQLQHVEQEPEEEACLEENTVWDKISHLLDRQLDELKSIRESMVPVSYEYFVASWREPERTAFLQQRFESARTEWEMVLKEGKDKGEFSPVLPTIEISRLLISVLEGLNISVLFVGYDESGAENQMASLKMMLTTVLGMGDKG